MRALRLDRPKLTAFLDRDPTVAFIEPREDPLGVMHKVVIDLLACHRVELSQRRSARKRTEQLEAEVAAAIVAVPQADQRPP